MTTDKLPEIGDVIGRQNSVDEVILDIKEEIDCDKIKVFVVTTNFRDGVNLEVKKVNDKFYDVTILFISISYV